MPLLPRPKDRELSDEARALFQDLQSKMGMVPSIFRLMGHAPDVLKSTLALNQSIQHDLPARLRELAYLKASELNGCKYCSHYHKALGRKTGLGDAQIRDLDHYESSPAYDTLEKAVLRFTEQWTKGKQADSAVIEELTQSLTPPQLVTLAATVALAGWTNRFNNTFAVELP